VEKSTTYGNQSGGLFQFICHTPTAMGIGTAAGMPQIIKLQKRFINISTCSRYTTLPFAVVEVVEEDHPSLPEDDPADYSQS